MINHESNLFPDNKLSYLRPDEEGVFTLIRQDKITGELKETNSREDIEELLDRGGYLSITYKTTDADMKRILNKIVQRSIGLEGADLNEVDIEKALSGEAFAFIKPKFHMMCPEDAKNIKENVKDLNIIAKNIYDYGGNEFKAEINQIRLNINLINFCVEEMHRVTKETLTKKHPEDDFVVIKPDTEREEFKYMNILYNERNAERKNLTQETINIMERLLT